MRSYKAGKFALVMMFCLLTIIMFAGTAQALMIEFSLDELTEGSDSIVIGSVISTSSQWNTDKTSIYTTVVISVEEIIKGEKELEGERITIVNAGGEVEGVIQAVSDIPVFNQGERALIFLQVYSEVRALTPDIDISQSTVPVFTVYGLFQGKLDIIDGKIENQSINEVVEKVSDISSGQWSGSEQTEAEEETTLTLVGQSPYTYGGQKWPGNWPNVYYKVNTSSGPSGSLIAIQNAARTWSNAGTRFSYVYDGTHSRTGGAERNSVNEVLWGNLGTNGTIAMAYWWFHQTGEIIEADIVFNTYHRWSTTGVDLDVETVALHEFGHWLSLGHSSVNEAIMWYQYKGIQRTLHADDIAGIKYIYGDSKGINYNLLASFASGTWWYSQPTYWENLSPSTAHAITYADVNNDGSLNLVDSFNSGTWYVGSGGDWIRLSSSTARTLAGNGSVLYASFRSGTWEYKNGTWNRKSTSSAHATTFADITGNGQLDLVASFNSGTWYLTGTGWVLISTSTARALSGKEDLLIASFPSGTWEYYQGSWYRISPSTAQAITFADVVDDGFWNPVFSYDSGTWFIEWTNRGWQWVKFSASTARALQSAGGQNFDLISTSLKAPR